MTVGAALVEQSDIGLFFFLNPWQKACRKAKPATDLKNGPFCLFYNQ